MELEELVELVIWYKLKFEFQCGILMKDLDIRIVPAPAIAIAIAIASPAQLAFQDRTPHVELEDTAVGTRPRGDSE